MSSRCKKCAWPLRTAEMQEAYGCREVRCLGLCDRCRIECLKAAKLGRIYQEWSDQHYSEEEKMPRKSDPLARLGQRIRNLASPPAAIQAASAPPPDTHTQSDRWMASIVDTLADKADDPHALIESVRRLDAQLALHPQLYAQVFSTLDEQGFINLDRWRALLRGQP